MLGISALGQLVFAQFPPTISRTLPKRESRGGTWWKRHPSGYSEEYYEALRPVLDAPETFYELPPVHVPNLRIPISRLIQPIMLPSLSQLPPFRPMPSLTHNPPAFRMTTPEEMAADDETVIAMLLED